MYVLIGKDSWMWGIKMLYIAVFIDYRITYAHWYIVHNVYCICIWIDTISDIDIKKVKVPKFRALFSYKYSGSILFGFHKFHNENKI